MKSQAPLFQLESHLSHNFHPKFWMSADLRYFGQAFEVRVPVPDAGPGGAFDAELADAVAEGLLARSAGAVTGEEPEPMPDWERDLLAGAPAAPVAEPVIEEIVVVTRDGCRFLSRPQKLIFLVPPAPTAGTIY